ncbi:MAG TPA: 50S ribosomal protein L32 [Chitinophagaceae bacterium]|nr:50S ribosomal protein L32 [Chitinophagaceae bacterium]
MPNPKRRHSQQRSAKRRTHYKASIDTLSTDKTTGETHMRHRAHWSENKLYYKGRVVLEKAVKEVSTPEEDNNEV